MAADQEAHSPPEQSEEKERSASALDPVPSEAAETALPSSEAETAAWPVEAVEPDPAPDPAPVLIGASPEEELLPPADHSSEPDLLHGTPADEHSTALVPHNGHDSGEAFDDAGYYGPPAIPPGRASGRPPGPTGEDPDQEDGGGAVKSFLEHLEDLRWTLIKSGSAALVGIVACLLAGNYLVEIMKVPLLRAGPSVPKLINLDPAGPFYVAFQLAIVGGLILASPFIFYFVLEFVLPALKMKEKKYFFRGLFVGGILFFTGVGFCYWFLLPVALKASVQYANWLGIDSSIGWQATQFFGFTTKFMLGMGLGFELPVVILILVKLNILSYSMLRKGRRYMVVINLVLGAVLTTPEIVTQLLMAIPLQLLYEATIWIAWYWERQEKKREALAAAVDP